MNFGSPVKFNKNEAQEMVIHVLGTDPGSPANGQIWFNSSGGVGAWQLKWNDSGTVRVLATMTAVLATRLDQFAAPTADLNFNSRRLTLVADPTAATDAANKQYVDALINGTDWKQSVRIATTASVTQSGLTAIDGITPVAGDRILDKDNATAANRGIWIAASGAWTRATDADGNAEVTAGMAIFVSEGTTNADTQWKLTTNDPITVGTTGLTFAQIGAGTSYTQGTGIIISGNTISIDVAVVVRKYGLTYGDGTTTSFTATHNLNTLDVQVVFRKVSTGEQWLINNVAATVNTVTFTHSVAPTANEFRVTIQA